MWFKLTHLDGSLFCVNMNTINAFYITDGGSELVIGEDCYKVKEPVSAIMDAINNIAHPLRIAQPGQAW